MKQLQLIGLIAWAALLVLLGMTIFLAYEPLGNFNLLVALCIAIAKALIIMAVFMELRERSGVMIAFAAAGFFWLGILMCLAAIAIYLWSDDLSWRPGTR